MNWNVCKNTRMHVTVVMIVNRLIETKNEKNHLWFLAPMQLPTHGQWWSNFDTQTLQELQCLDRGGRKILHVEQYLYPNGPPIEVSTSWGIGALTGDDMGGKIPGSLVALTHMVRNDEIVKTTVSHTVMEWVVHWNGDT